MFYFCTYFDSNYLIKGLALYRSLVSHAAPFRLWVLCFDDLTYEILEGLALPEVHPILLRDFEDGDEELLRAKSSRSRIEYYFTCTPSLLLYVLRNCHEVNVITYLDADLFFFSEQYPVYQEFGNNSIFIIGHHFPLQLSHLEKVGIYNVSFISFSRDKHAFECLYWWRDRCLEWCYDRSEYGRYADQKYLDDWPTRFPGVVVLQHKGAGLAPWSIENYSLRLENGRVLVDSQPLVFFHFHGLKQIGRWLYNPNLARYGVRTDSLLKRCIYGPYLRELHEVRRWISDCPPVSQSHVHMGSIRDMPLGVPISDGLFRATARRAKRQLHIIRMALQEGNLWVVIAGRVV